MNDTVSWAWLLGNGWLYLGSVRIGMGFLVGGRWSLNNVSMGQA